MIAIDKKFYEGVCALINGGADVNDEDIFHHFFYEISICLILQYFKFFEMEFFFCAYWTPLHYAAKAGDARIVEMLLNFKTDPNKADIFLFIFLFCFILDFLT